MNAAYELFRVAARMRVAGLSRCAKLVYGAVEGTVEVELEKLIKLNNRIFKVYPYLSEPFYGVGITEVDLGRRYDKAARVFYSQVFSKNEFLFSWACGPEIFKKLKNGFASFFKHSDKVDFGGGEIPFDLRMSLETLANLISKAYQKLLEKEEELSSDPFLRSAWGEGSVAMMLSLFGVFGGYDDKIAKQIVRDPLSVKELDLTPSKISNVGGDSVCALFLNVLPKLKNLKKLNVSNQGLGDSCFDGFKLPNLRTLYVDNNKIENLGWVKNLPKLKFLSLDGNEGIRDVSSLSGLHSLVGLYLTDVKNLDLSPIANLRGLENLYVHKSCDLGPIEGRIKNKRNCVLDGNWYLDLESL